MSLNGINRWDYKLKESFVGFMQGAYYAYQYQYISGEYSPNYDAE